MKLFSARHLALIIASSVSLITLQPSSADAAIAHVKSLGTFTPLIATAATSTTMDAAAGGAAVGNTIIVTFAMTPTAGAVSCSDQKGNTYSVDADVTNTNASGGPRTIICSAPVTTALVAGDDITVSHPSVTARAMSVSEFSGLLSAAPLDKTTSTFGNSSTPSSGATATTAQANELLIGAIGVRALGLAAFAAGSGYTTLPSTGSLTLPSFTILPEYRIVGAVGAYEANGTMTNLIGGGAASRQWAAAIATYKEPASAVCGDGTVGAGESCDDGNLLAGDCCSPTCTFESAATVCRGAFDACDAEETCTGASATCPADAFAPDGTACGDSSDTTCDAPDTCNGAGACEANLEPDTTVCRSAVDACDAEETCDGAGDCPADELADAGTACGDSSDTTCDAPDTCDGAGTCEPNFASGATLCRSALGECDVAEFCDGAGDCEADGFVGAGTACGDPGSACVNQDTCNGGGSCTDNGFASAGTACGNPGDSVCDDPDTCNGGGACVENHEPDTVECRPDDGECDVAESCDGNGACPADVLASAGTACGDPGDTDCDNPDTCNASGACEANHVAAAASCGDPTDTDCTDPDTCDGSGACLPNHETPGLTCGGEATDCTSAGTCNAGGTCSGTTFAAAGTPCGDATDTTCDAPDTCDGAGACEVNHEPDTVECRPDAGDCDVAESCDGNGACPADVVASAGTPCGDAGDTVCDNPDTCNASGTCVENHEPDTVECRPDAGDCDVAESCDGAGACPADVVASAGTACGDSGNTDCDNPDTCNASGACVENHEPGTTECRASTGDCDVAESCDGAGGCPADVVASAGTACGAPGDSVCDNPDTCNASGTCVENHEPNTVECRPDAGDCDVAESCDGNGACPADVVASAGTACGNAGDSDCDNPDTCNASGTCVENHEPNTVECRADAGDCDVSESCDGNGACPADVVASAGTACGAPGDSVCDNPDTCNASGTCVENHEPETVECRADAGDCDVAESCDGAGACPADGFASAGTACGAPGDSDCDNPDTCNASGTCVENLEPNTVECRPDAGDCDVAESCDGAGACPADVLASAGTACGDPADTDCDNPDTCNASGACEANHVAAAASCGDPTDTDCTDPDTCDGDGACLPNHETPGLACGGEATDCTSAGTCNADGTCSGTTFATAGTACGSPSDTECDNPDTCDGAGACEPNAELAGTGCGEATDGDCDNPDSCDGSGACGANPEPATFECRATTGECDPAELCDGAGACPADAFATAGTACGDVSDTDCDDPDTCDASGSCAANPASAATLCRAADGVCDAAELCDGLGTCPADAVAIAGFECRAADGECDVGESCDGASKECPADAVAASGTVCGEVDGECDSEGTCDGSSKACPADTDDADGDGICDNADPCPNDALNDADGDGFCVGAGFNAPKIGGDDNCPTVVNPTQANADADASGDLCDYVCFAPALDSTRVLSGAMATGTDYTGGADNDAVLDSLSTRLLFADSATNASGLTADNASYTISLPGPYSWYAFGRFYYPGAVHATFSDANSFFLRIDGGASGKFGNNDGFFQTWHWDGNGNTAGGPLDALPVGVLSSGVHTVTIYKREVLPLPVAPRLDLVCFAPRAVAPSDAEACANTPEGDCGAPTTTVSSSTTTTTTTSTTSSTVPPPADLVCLRAGSDPSLVLNGQMTTGVQFTGGADLDLAADNLTTPLLFNVTSGNTSNATNAHRARYDVEIPADGSWFLWGRFYYPGVSGPSTSDGNSFFAQLDSGTSDRFGNNDDFFRLWHWGGNGAQVHGTPSGVALGNVTAGTHTLTIRKRETEPVAPRLDVLCVSIDGVTPPTDAEACAALGGCP